VAADLAVAVAVDSAAAAADFPAAAHRAAGEMNLARTIWRNAIVGLFAGLSVVLASALAFADERTPIPDLHARVTDVTQTLTAEQTAALDGELAALETRKGAQLALLMIPTLAAPADVPAQTQDIESYATRVFEQWKLGRKRVDDGVLLIVVKNDHKVRIEVGYGLEGAIPDAAAARIIREYIAPRFRDGDYYGGIHDATTALAALVDGEALPAPLEGAQVAQFSAGQGDLESFLPVLILFGAGIIGLFGGLLLAHIFKFFPIGVFPIVARRAAGFAITAAIFCIVCFSQLQTPLPQSVLVTLAAGVLTAGGLGWYLAPRDASRVWGRGLTGKEPFSEILFAFLGLMLTELVDSVASSSGSSGSGSDASGSSGSGSSGGGDFSGGGGSSGGGGASGSW
jgi:uncharacterized protein